MAETAETIEVKLLPNANVKGKTDKEWTPPLKGRQEARHLCGERY